MEEKKMNIPEVLERTAEFLMEFEGIQAAYPINEIINYAGSSIDVRSKYRNSYHKNTSGDIVITLLPGWVEVDDKNQLVGTANAPRVYISFYLLGAKIKPQKVNVACQTIDIAPTLARLLGIPTPNACVGKSLLDD